MTARMKNPGTLLPGVTTAIQHLHKAIAKVDVPDRALSLVHLRASQINGCAPCLEFGTKEAKEHGESDERLWGLAAWRETPYYTEAERAALALAEAMTRLADNPESVSDEIWADVEKHYDEEARAALVIWVATTNLFNRINTTVRHPAGGAWE
jgi:AhpD family alkylhydroperoxidase